MSLHQREARDRRVDAFGLQRPDPSGCTRAFNPVANVDVMVTGNQMLSPLIAHRPLSLTFISEGRLQSTRL